MITPFSSWRKEVYIAKRTSVTRTKGDQTQVFDAPLPYNLNVQPMNEQTRVEMFGANAKKMFKAIVVNNSYDINEMDRVYLDDATPLDEVNNGDNANYIVRRVAKQNIVNAYYFESIKG